MRKILFVFLISALFSFYSFSQESFIYNIGQIQVTLPEKWFYVLNEDGSMTVYTPKKELSISFNILEAKDLDSASRELDKDLSKKYKNISFEVPREQDINQLHTLMMSGKDTTSKVNFEYTLIMTTNAKVMAIGSSASEEAFKKHEKEFFELIHGIKPFIKE